LSRIWNSQVFALIASLILLGGAGAERLSLSAPSDAAPYHAHVRQISQAVPMNIGQWVGQDVPVSSDTLDMLMPNVLINRRYQLPGKRPVSFLMVQCDDVRALENHYPPHCYVAMGYTKLWEAQRNWNVAGVRVTGMEYQFAQEALDPSTAITVENFMVLPDRGIVRDMDPVSAAAADVRRRKYGAAEFQVLFEHGVGAEDRAKVVEELLAPYMPVIAAIDSH